MARTKKVNESEADFESTDLYSDGEGKGAVLQTLDAPDKSKENKKSIAGAAGVEPADHELDGAVEEAFSALFDGEGLSESFKNNVKGLFEATLSERTQQISEEMKDDVRITKLNIDENPATPQKYNVRGIPTLLLFKNGEVVAEKVGALPKAQLQEWISSNVNSE